ncbi:MAG: CocE/NonD family hydrolase [Deltaproteobacteria bacterium]|nr:CocE/NonD family hydrolase [Deltaproteobacteria bacterium]MBW2361988.1 CocE/NonD family hydrolase [Deltaproteobacteria bacterium]
MAHDIIVERDCMVKMRDGVALAADIYRPADDAEHPVLVNLHPYDNDSFLVVHELLFSPLIAAQRGYVVVSAEARGRAGSEGEWRPYGEEAGDAYDTVEWAAAQPWSDGNVGLYGACALGLATLQGVVESPPHLKAAFAYMTATNYHSGWTYSTGGAFELGFQMSWVWTILARDTLSRLDLDPAALTEAHNKLAEASGDMNKSASYLPLVDFPPYQNGAAPYWREWLSHPSYDEFWERVDNVAHADRIKVPVLHMSAWYDTCLKGHMELDAALEKNGDERVRDQHRMIIGPTDHSAYYNKRPSCAGERDFGPEALTGPEVVSGQVFEWFDHWLRGEEKTFMPENRVRYYQMGENVWKETRSWPPAHTLQPYYLHSAGHANSRMGDGTLDTEAPGIEPLDSYVYDPMEPVPTTGGRSMIDVATGVENQAQVEEREDVLVYTTPRLADAVVLNGPVSVTLHASSDAPDTDFTAKLVDVEPDGYCANISEGIIRARYRNGREKEVFLEPGEVTEFTIDLWDIAHTFKPNHKIRLEVSSSNFPRFDRNLNSRVTPALGSAEDAKKAVQQIFHDAPHLSRLNLPVADG